MSALSDLQGIQHQDPAERLAAALRRIAVGIERREAVAASTQAALDAALRNESVFQRPPASEGAAPPAVVANIDSLIARLRAVLDELPADRTRATPAPDAIQPGDARSGGERDEGS